MKSPMLKVDKPLRKGWFTLPDLSRLVLAGGKWIRLSENAVQMKLLIASTSKPTRVVRLYVEPHREET
jgi:hypothetical protein